MNFSLTPLSTDMSANQAAAVAHLYMAKLYLCMLHTYTLGTLCKGTEIKQDWRGQSCLVYLCFTLSSPFGGRVSGHCTD